MGGDYFIILFIEHSGDITILISHIYIYIYIYIIIIITSSILSKSLEIYLCNHQKLSIFLQFDSLTTFMLLHTEKFNVKFVIWVFVRINHFMHNIEKWPDIL